MLFIFFVGWFCFAGFFCCCFLSFVGFCWLCCCSSCLRSAFVFLLSTATQPFLSSVHTYPYTYTDTYTHAKRETLSLSTLHISFRLSRYNKLSYYTDIDGWETNVKEMYRCKNTRRRSKKKRDEVHPNDFDCYIFQTYFNFFLDEYCCTHFVYAFMCCNLNNPLNFNSLVLFVGDTFKCTNVFCMRMYLVGASFFHLTRLLDMNI